MSCFRPGLAFQTAEGDVVFAERGDVVRTLSLPCGKCVGCLSQRAAEWGTRICHEAKLHVEKCFVTPTYAPEHYPVDGCLSVEEVQKAIDRLRKYVKRERGVSLRYAWRSEYGPRTGRAHHHCVLFGWRPDDLKAWKKSKKGHQLYRSEVFERLWGKGCCEIGELEAGSANYVGGYVGDKVVKQRGERYGIIDPITGEFFERTPEFFLMSRKPPIGWRWVEKYASDFWPRGTVVVDGVERAIPRAYLKRFAAADPDGAELLKLRKLQESRKRFEDNTPERLRVKEAVKLDEINRWSRVL